MKKIIILIAMLNISFASDLITIDSLFKKQIGLRSITNLSFLSTGNANSYNLYPILSTTGDPTIWNDTKQLSLNQTFIYTLAPKFDILVSANGSWARREYINIFTNAYSNDTKMKLNGFWLGFIYTGDSFYELIPQLTFQTAIIQNEEAFGEDKKFYLKSQNIQGTLRGYSDPVVYSIYAGFGYNQKRNFDFADITYGNSMYFGGDLSIILSPKISLDLGIEQRLQTKQKINGIQNSELRSIPTYSVGSTYSIDDNTAIGINASFGGSSAAPDSVFGITIWKKF